MCGKVVIFKHHTLVEWTTSFCTKYGWICYIQQFVDANAYTKKLFVAVYAIYLCNYTIFNPLKTQEPKHVFFRFVYKEKKMRN